MPKKRNIKKILIITLILLVAIIVVRDLIVDAIERANIENKVYTSVTDFRSIKEIAEYMGCTYIKEEKSTSEEYDLDIYLKFKYALYTDEVSNEEYYYRMIALMLGYLDYQNIRLVDQANDIVIVVQADSEKQEITKLLINGQIDYFGTQETLKSIKDYQILDAVELEIQAEEVKNLIAQNWVAKEVEFGTKESNFENYDIYFDEGIEVKTINKKVFNIIFTEKYNKEIVNGIKVNTPFEEIKQILGTPTFSNENYIETTQKDIGYIGYKGLDIYVFFSENEISVYRVEEPNTSTGLADAIANFQSETQLRSFVSTITDMWPDYDYYGYDEENVELKYSLRGIRISFNSSEAGVFVYNNYNGYIADGVTIEEIVQDTKVLPSTVKLKIEEDLVNIYEQNRITTYNNNYGNTFMGQPHRTTSEFKINFTTDAIKFLSTNRTYPNSTLDMTSRTFINYSDTEFIIANSEGQVHKYNAATLELSDLSEDTSILTVNNQKFLYLKGSGIYAYNIETNNLHQMLEFQNELTGLYDYDGTSLIIGIKNMGIYRFNTTTNELITLAQGEAEFKITTIYEDKVFYDDTLTLVK